MKKIWTIHQLERKAIDDFVITVHWRLSIEDNDEFGNNYYADTYSVLHYTEDEKTDDIIPYTELTKEIVIGWVKDYLGEVQLRKIEENLINQIEQQKNPPVLSGVPWQTT
jgi:hypothetical protein